MLESIIIAALIVLCIAYLARRFSQASKGVCLCGKASAAQAECSLSGMPNAGNSGPEAGTAGAAGSASQGAGGCSSCKHCAGCSGGCR